MRDSLFILCGQYEDHPATPIWYLAMKTYIQDENMNKSDSIVIDISKRDLGKNVTTYWVTLL